MRGLKGKRVVITGGASGIGAATAARFLEEGSRVCVVDRDDAACKRIKQELRCGWVLRPSLPTSPTLCRSRRRLPKRCV